MGLGKKKMLSQGASGVTPTDNFAPKLYTGNGASSRSITGVGFAPDFIWIKKRGTSTGNHLLQNTVQGAGTNSALSSNSTGAKGYFDQYGYISAFGTDGFTLQGGTSGSYPNDNANENNSTYVAWNWKAGGAAVSNTSGSITSQVSANQAAGFSIVKYEGGGSSATIGHGLSSAPEITIIKKTSAAEDWYYQSETQLGGWNKNLRLNTSAAEETSSTFVTGVDASTISLGTSTAVNGTSTDYIAYCFHSVTGYQKIGSYTGTGATGKSVTTGFRPRFVMLKNADFAGQSWNIWDSERSPSDPRNLTLFPNDAQAELTQTNGMNFSATGFEILNGTNWMNRSGDTIIYLAIA
jgi:hypothetical protein